MKKISKKFPFSRKLAILVPVLLVAGIAAVRAVELHEARVGHPLSMAANRHVKNVTCTGRCTNVVLASDQEPDVQYFEGATQPTCSESMLWANANGREDQIVFGGYEFINGFQDNLPTQTFGPDALNGKDIEFTLPGSGDVFTAHVKDTGEWNLLDSVTCNELMCAGPERIFTDRDSGRVKLYDSCDASSDRVKIFTLYQAPELHGPDADDTYRVDVGLRALPSTGSTSGMVEGAGFEQVYASSELTDDTIHVIADVGDTTFEFDLVKDEE